MPTLTDRQHELINYALTIMERRASQEDRPVASKISYNSCICMICYALEEDEESLKQFDY